jgi:hypothetical protein
MTPIAAAAFAPAVVKALHHYRRRRGLAVCALCGKPKAERRHWEAAS